MGESLADYFSFTQITKFVSDSTILSSIFVCAAIMGISIWIYVIACCCLRCTQRRRPKQRYARADNCRQSGRKPRRKRNGYERTPRNYDSCRCLNSASGGGGGGNGDGSTYNIRRNWRDKLCCTDTTRYAAGYDKLPSAWDVENQAHFESDARTLTDSNAPLVYSWLESQQQQQQPKCSLESSVAAHATVGKSSKEERQHVAINLERKQPSAYKLDHERKLQHKRQKGGSEKSGRAEKLSLDFEHKRNYNGGTDDSNQTAQIEFYDPLLFFWLESQQQPECSLESRIASHAQDEGKQQNVDMDIDIGLESKQPSLYNLELEREESGNDESELQRKRQKDGSEKSSRAEKLSLDFERKPEHSGVDFNDPLMFNWFESQQQPECSLKSSIVSHASVSEMSHEEQQQQNVDMDIDIGLESKQPSLYNLELGHEESGNDESELQHKRQIGGSEKSSRAEKLSLDFERKPEHSGGTDDIKQTAQIDFNDPLMFNWFESQQSECDLDNSVTAHASASELSQEEQHVDMDIDIGLESKQPLVYNMKLEHEESGTDESEMQHKRLKDVSEKSNRASGAEKLSLEIGRKQDHSVACNDSLVLSWLERQQQQPESSIVSHASVGGLSPAEKEQHVDIAIGLESKQPSSSYNLELEAEKSANDRSELQHKRQKSVSEKSSRAEKLSLDFKRKREHSGDGADGSKRSAQSNKSSKKNPTTQGLQRKTNYRPKYMLSSSDSSWITQYSSTSS